jgi:hypothetical protein
MDADFIVENHGTVWVFTAITEDAKSELDVMGLEDWQFVGEDSFAVDHRVARNLVEALANNFHIV